MEAKKFEWKSEQQRDAVRLFIRALLLAHNNSLTCTQTWSAVIERFFGIHPTLAPVAVLEALDAPRFSQVVVLWAEERKAIRENLVGTPTGPNSVRYPKGQLVLDPLPTGAARRRFRRKPSMRRSWLPMQCDLVGS